MRPLEIGLALGSSRSTRDPSVLAWSELRDLAVHAEAIGFDTVWQPDGLIHRTERDGPIHGSWDTIAIAAALAAVTTRVKLGTWVLSGLYHRPGQVAKAAATLDEISGGRFVLGFGAGFAGVATRAFGIPDDHVYERFEEALEIVVPLIRGARAELDGAYHTARDLPQIPAGPRPVGIPLLLAAHGPKGYRHAARLADIWSCYAMETSDVAELGPRVVALERACAEVGRDPATIGRSGGVVVAPLATDPVMSFYGSAITGPPERIADAFRDLHAAGFSQLEVMLEPLGTAEVEALAPVLELLDA